MARNSPQEDSSLKAIRTCRSQPLSTLEASNIRPYLPNLAAIAIEFYLLSYFILLQYAQKTETSIVSLAEYLGTNIYEHVPE